MKFKFVLAFLIALNVVAVFVLTTKFRHDHTPLSRINSVNTSALEGKLVAWGAFSSAEADTIILMQQRYINNGDIRRPDIDTLLQILRSSAPRLNTDTNVRRIVCMSLLADAVRTYPLSITQHRTLVDQLNSTFRRTNVAPAETMLAAMCADRGACKECLKYILPLQDDPNEKVRIFANKFIEHWSK